MGARYKRPVTPAEREHRDQARADKLTALHDRLTDQVAALRSGQDWRAWLDVAHRFHSYSLNNTLLIWAQRPEATTVAGYQAWKALGRQVDKGEQGIQILAPVAGNGQSGGADADPARAATANTGTPGAPSGADPNGDQEKERDPVGQRRVTGFRVAYVWDVSQTSGEPLPTQPAPRLLSGQAPPGLWDSLAALAGDRGYTLQRGDCGHANGWTNHTSATIRVRNDVDDAQAVKTLAHELGHVLLHQPGESRDPSDPHHPGESTTVHCRGVAEVEAESVAYLVAATHGLPTDDYTFAYVTSWAADVNQAKPETVVRDTASRVLAATRTILAATNRHTTDIQPDLAARVHTGAQRTAAALHHAHTTHAGQIAKGSADPAGVVAATGAIADAAVGSVSIAALRRLHADATAFYTEQLGAGTPDAGRATAMLAERGVPSEAVAAYQIGYAPPGWTTLVDHLTAAGYTNQHLLAAGVATSTSRGTLVDRFRNRIIFPIHHPDGHVIAFLGRALQPGENTPNYLNSPTTALYRKSEVLYGLGAGPTRHALTGGAQTVLVEGPLDAIAITTAGDGRYAGIAPSGTALTPGQIAALNDAAGPLERGGVVVAFDADSPGRDAALRAYQPLRAAGAWPTTATLTDGHDPASVVQHHGAGALRAALDGATPLVDLVVDQRVDHWATQLQWVDGRVGAARSAAPVIAALPAEHMPRQIHRLVQGLDIAPETVTTAVADLIARGSDAPGRLERRDRRNDLHRGQGLSERTTPTQLAGTGYPTSLATTAANTAAAALISSGEPPQQQAGALGRQPASGPIGHRSVDGRRS